MTDEDTERAEYMAAEYNAWFMEPYFYRFTCEWPPPEAVSSEDWTKGWNAAYHAAYDCCCSGACEQSDPPATAEGQAGWLAFVVTRET